MISTRACVLFFTAAALDAQAPPIVSPAFYASEEGTSLSTLPFGSSTSTTGYPLRSQQVVGGLQGSARSFRWLAFRRDGSIGSNPLFGARSVTLDLHAGHGSYASATATFSTNYTSTRTQVFGKRAFSLPDITTLPRAVPAPFSLRIAFDSPFTYTGKADFVWEATAFHQLKGPGSVTPVDASFSGMNIVMPSGYRMNGTGCKAKGGANEMQLRSTGSLQNFPVNAWILALSVTDAPPSAAGLLLLGLANPNYPLPGLCTTLYVSPLITLPGAVPASGSWLPLSGITPAPRIPYQSSLVGTYFHAQAAADDTTQAPGLKLAASNGLSVRFNDWTPTFQVAQISETGTSTGKGTLSTAVAAIVELGQ